MQFFNSSSVGRSVTEKGHRTCHGPVRLLVDRQQPCGRFFR